MTGWAAFWWFMAACLVVGLVLKFWYLVLVIVVAVGTYRLIRRWREENERLLYNTSQTDPSRWLTREQWRRR
jgi:hypothetical protein